MDAGTPRITWGSTDDPSSSFDLFRLIEAGNAGAAIVVDFFAVLPEYTSELILTHNLKVTFASGMMIEPTGIGKHK